MNYSKKGATEHVCTGKKQETKSLQNVLRPSITTILKSYDTDSVCATKMHSLKSVEHAVIAV
jgi:hypothetical protein